jgi:hypothetical protein
MSISPVESGRRGARIRWSGTTPEQRRQGTRAARRALAVKELVDQAPELTEEQRTRLRTLLQPPEAS